MNLNEISPQGRDDISLLKSRYELAIRSNLSFRVLLRLKCILIESSKRGREISSQGSDNLI